MMTHFSRGQAVAFSLACALIAGCGGSSDFTPAPVSPGSPTNAPTSAPTNASSQTTLISNGQTVSLPNANGFAGSLTLPQSGVPTGESVTISSLAASPAGVPQSLGAVTRRLDAGPRTSMVAAPVLVAPYLTFQFPITLTLPQSFALSIVPAPAGLSVSQQVTVIAADITNPNSPSIVYNETGSVSTQGSTTALIFPAITAPSGLTFSAGRTYAFGIYVGAAPTPTNSPTNTPTNSPTTAPTNSPTTAPTNSPTTAPTNSPTTAPTNSPTTAPTNSPTTAPTNKPSSASTDAPIASAGGTLTLPAYGTFTGSIDYPSNNAPTGTTATLTSSTTDLNGTLPSPSGSTSVFFEQLRLNSSASSVTFNSGNGGASLSSTALTASKTYTLNVYVYAFGSNQLITSQNLGSPTNGTLSFSSPFSGIQVPTGSSVTLNFQQN